MISSLRDLDYVSIRGTDEAKDIESSWKKTTLFFFVFFLGLVVYHSSRIFGEKEKRNSNSL
jgi:hypothetical protein